MEENIGGASDSSTAKSADELPQQAGQTFEISPADHIDSLLDHEVLQAQPSDNDSKDESEQKSKPLSSILRLNRPQKALNDQGGTEADVETERPKRRNPIRFRLHRTVEGRAEHNTSNLGSKAAAQMRYPRRQGNRSNRHRPRRIRRSSSSHDALKAPERTVNIVRSSSEHHYRSESHQVTRLQSNRSVASPRAHQPSRRWGDDNYAAEEAHAEGELDGFFRFIDNCRRATWQMICSVPQAISQIPRLFMGILRVLIPALQRPIPAIEAAPCNEV